MALSNTTKLAIKAKLKLGMPPKEVAQTFDVNETTVYAINRQVNREEIPDLVQKVQSVPVEVVAHVVEEAKIKAERSPTTKNQTAMIEGLDVVAQGLDGLKVLDRCYQTNITKGLNRLGLILDDRETPLKEIKICIDTMSNSYEKIFNSGTNIHIGDNNSHSNQNLTVFKNRQGV